MAKKLTLLLVSSLLLTLYPVICFARNNLEKQKCSFQVSQETLIIEGFKDEQGTTYLSLADKEVSNLCLTMGGILTYLKESDSWCINKDTTNTIINPACPGDMGNEIIVTNEEKVVLIKTEKLAELLKGRLMYDKTKDIFLLRPYISDISTQEQNGELILKIEATSNIKYSSSLLHNPERAVIEIENAALSRTVKLPDHPLLTGALIETSETEAWSVKLTIPAQKGCNVAVQPRILPQSILVKFTEHNEAPGLSAETAETSLDSITIEDTKDYVKIRIDTSAPFSYQWRRLNPPDNRFFVDFLDTTLKAEQTSFEPQNLLVRKIRAAQLQPGTDGTTRLVLDLTQPAVCELSTTSGSPGQLIITVKSQLIDTDRTLLCGRGTTISDQYQYSAHGQVIVIDPGHGGSDRGAYNASLSLEEKDVTLAISYRLADILKRKGWKVLLTRTSDRDVSYAGSPDKEELMARTNVAQYSNAQLFISVHINASVNKQAHGISTHWYKNCDKLLAQEVHCQLVEKTGRRDRGIPRDRFFVLRNTDIPSILVEAGFISNDEEASLLTNDEYLQRIAEAVANGLGTYMGKTMQRKITAKSSSSSKK